MRAVDVFSGCGGMSLGFEQAGVDVVAAFDKWAPAVEIYRANFNHPIYEKDLCDEDSVDQIRSMAPDLIMAARLAKITLSPASVSRASVRI